jgi:hypothetical protein
VPERGRSRIIQQRRNNFCSILLYVFMRELFSPHTFRPKTLVRIEQANTILAEYAGQGFVLTLRQLFYQFVARQLVENTQRNYDNLGDTLVNARNVGLVDWDLIEDRTRDLQALSTWNSPVDLLQAAAEQYRAPLWESQKYRPEVWIEKSALVGVIEPACTRWRVPHFAARGYSSISELYLAGKRFAAYALRDLLPVVFYLGDHDPSGLHMVLHGLPDALSLYARQRIEVRHIGLTLDQARDLPPNFAKENDARHGWYVDRTGTTDCWELDALEPTVIDSLLDTAIREIVDSETWDAALRNEELEKIRLAEVANSFAAE